MSRLVSQETHAPGGATRGADTRIVATEQD